VEAGAGASPLAEHLKLRRQTAPLVDEFFTSAEATPGKLSAKSSLAGASRYAINRCGALSRIISDGQRKVDNNVAENALRRIAIGHKNYLFAGSDPGGQRAADIYILVKNAKLNDVNPGAYLRNILATVAVVHPRNKIESLLPLES